MAYKLGNDYRLWVGSATPGTYNEIQGNQDLSISRQAGTIDLGTKSDFPYGASGPGSRNLTLTASFNPDLPDADGYGRLEDLINAAVSTTIPLQIRRGGSSGAAPADVVFECEMYCTGHDTSFGRNAGVNTPFTFVNAAAPTIDELK
jgi:hypothetical protein